VIRRLVVPYLAALLAPASALAGLCVIAGVNPLYGLAYGVVVWLPLPVFHLFAPKAPSPAIPERSAGRDPRDWDGDGERDDYRAARRANQDRFAGAEAGRRGYTDPAPALPEDEDWDPGEEDEDTADDVPERYPVDLDDPLAPPPPGSWRNTPPIASPGVHLYDPRTDSVQPPDPAPDATQTFPRHQLGRTDPTADPATGPINHQ
jgi:hypothetical protein